jgi:hypothetical protein
MLSAYGLEADGCTLRSLARPVPTALRGIPAGRVLQGLSRNEVHGYRGAALKLLSLVLLLNDKRTLEPKAAKLRQPRRNRLPWFMISNHYILEPILLGSQPMESGYIASRFLSSCCATKSSDGKRTAPACSYFQCAADALSRYQMTTPRSNTRCATMPPCGSRLKPSIGAVRPR